MKNLSLIIVFFTMVSCQQVAKVALGFKNPKLKNIETVKNYMMENSLKPDNNYVCKDLSSYKQIIKVFNKHIREAVLFDKDGNELIYKETAESCNAGLFKVIPDLNKTSRLKKGAKSGKHFN